MQIECKDISYQYPQTGTNVFDHLNCQITGAGFHALFGSSGLGKTTLARMIAREISGYAGQIRLDQFSEILYTHNLERFPGWASVEELIVSCTSASAMNRLDSLVNIFGVLSCMTSRFSRLSLGQKNRVNLIRYLLQEFDLLIMDESLANVDEITRGRIIVALKAMFPEKCFLYISHNMLEVAKFCHQIILLRRPDRQPQIQVVLGQNLLREDIFSMKDVERTMLEMVYAS